MARTTKALNLTEEDLKYIAEYGPFTPLKVFANKFKCTTRALEQYFVRNPEANSVWLEAKAKGHEIGIDNMLKFLQYNGEDIEEKKLQASMLKFYLSNKSWKEDNSIKLSDDDIKEITSTKDIDTAIATLTSKLLKCDSINKHDAIELIKLLSNVKISEDFNKQDNVLKDYTTPNERFQIKTILKNAEHRKEQGKPFN